MPKIGKVRYPRDVWNEMQRDAAPDKEEQEEMIARRKQWSQELLQGKMGNELKRFLEWLNWAHLLDKKHSDKWINETVCDYVHYFMRDDL